MALTDEQRLMIDKVLAGKNVLVDACVGSGKTTTIQALCSEFPKNKKILYLTYNRLLKIDAKEKIKGKNTTVTNYHGYAYSRLISINQQVGTPDLLQEFNRLKPPIPKYDLIVLDEYQDIDQEISEMLMHIKNNNPEAQLVAVGDMRQKIYDKTALDVQSFIEDFLGEHVLLEFTKCFRLPAEYAEKIGRIWGKKIIGVNDECKVETMTEKEVVKFLAEQDAKDILCLGSRNGVLAKVLNKLETKYREKYNKNTVYASISDDGALGKVQPDKDTAIFTTFDSSKGLERDICVVFDFTEGYWRVRVRQPQQKYEILKNIFLVAASRGKKRIIFVPGSDSLLSERSLSMPESSNGNLPDLNISEMFDFKYQEDIEDCFSLIKKRRIRQEDESIIDVRSSDGLIDLSPCIGIFQEASYFANYDIDKAFELYKRTHKDRNVFDDKIKSLEKKILYLTSLETSQRRYFNQVDLPLVPKEQEDLIAKRLSHYLQKDEDEQIFCDIYFSEGGFWALGYADVVKNNTVYELKFVSELTHAHFLQCASYMIALKLKKGILWNVRNNEMYEITIPDEKKFLNAITRTITKRRYKQFA